MEKPESFVAEPGFCMTCGDILPLVKEKGLIACYTCKEEYDPRILGSMQVKYTIHFNSLDAYAKDIKTELEEDGPVVDRKCPKCGNDQMSYATIQLRSADEGQTIFYTCTKCKFKENENS